MTVEKSGSVMPYWAMPVLSAHPVFDGVGTGDGVSPSGGTDTSAAAIAAAADPDATPRQSDDELMEAAFSALEESEAGEGAERDQNGRFVARQRAESEAEPSPSEGEQPGEQPPASSTVPSDASQAAIPANWHGQDELWNAIPAELRPKIAEIQRGLHETASQQGRTLAALKPVSQAIAEYRHYFDGSLKDASGKAIQYEPGEAISYLFKVQSDMDKNPTETILQIVDRYGVRDQLFALLGGDGSASVPDQRDATITELRQQVARLTQQVDPAKLEEQVTAVIDKRQNGAELDAFASDVKKAPLWKEVVADLPFFIRKVRAEPGGENLSRSQILERAYNKAVDADPALRSKAAALKAAANGQQQQPDRARAARSINVHSRPGSGGGAPKTDDEAMEAKWAELETQD